MMEQFKTGLSNSRGKRISKQGGEGLVTFDTVEGLCANILITASTNDEAKSLDLPDPVSGGGSSSSSSTSLDIGIGGSGLGIVVAIDGKSWAWVDEYDVETAKVEINVFGLERNERERLK
ncbi:hypothetical protein TNCV_4902221 [Trichonephila clavipes]|nr:hypothetical protein TNCV_4902221 [Trichonephila clavipes]